MESKKYLINLEMGTVTNEPKKISKKKFKIGSIFMFFHLKLW